MPDEMVSRRIALMCVGLQSSTNAGMWLDKYSEKLGGSENNKRHMQHVVETMRISNEYRRHYERWERALKEKETKQEVRTAKSKVEGRMVVGLGSESILETSISLHRTYGVPMIPGSALKGLASASAHRFLADPEWRKKSKAASTEQGPSHEILFGNTKAAGFVTFHDALLVPETTELPIDLDVMTVHHPDYYGTGKTPPADWDSPNPISFVTARGTYLIALEGPEVWTRAAMEILGEALSEEGIGAKTAAGYGRMRVERYCAEDREAKRQTEATARENKRQRVEALLRNLSPGNAGQNVPEILNDVSADLRATTAKSIIEKLGAKALKGKDDKAWVKQLRAALGEKP